MTALTLTPAPGTGSTRITVTPTATVTRIRRTDANGTADVRTLPGLLPKTGTDPFDLDDYEAANGPATYTVTTSAGSVSAAATLALGSPWLGVPVTPQFSARAENIYGYDAGGESRSTVLEPDGSPFPIVISRGGSTRRGSLEIWAGTYAAALDLFRLCQRGQVIMLRQSDHAGMDMYFHASRFSINPLVVRPSGDTVWGVKADYLEVGRPSAALSGALGWTWGGLKNTFATWADVSAAYASWGDVRINRRLP